MKNHLFFLRLSCFNQAKVQVDELQNIFLLQSFEENANFKSLK